MNKQEILEYIKYKGKYTKEVKSKLNKLIKKYHPDKNKDDKETILILYEVKKDLEAGKELKYKKEKKEDIKEEQEQEEENNINVFFIERIIRVLKQRKKFIQKQLNNLYKKSYYYINKIYEESYDKGLIDIKIEELDNNINFIKKVDNIEILILLTIILILFISIISKKFFLVIFIIFPILFEASYLKSKQKYINDTKKLIEKLNRKRKEFIDREEEYNKNIEELRKNEIELEREIKTINNDIQFYNNELSKANKKDKVNEKDYEDDIIFTKKSR